MESSRLGTFCLFISCAFFVAHQFDSCHGISLDISVQLHTEEMRHNFEEFKVRVKPLLYLDWMAEDSFLIRFLRARLFNVDKACEWLKDYVNWRLHSNMDTIQSENWSEFEKNYPYTASGFDREGRPLVLYQAEDWDIRKAAVSGKLKQLNRYFEKILDEIEIRVRTQQEFNRNVTQAVILIDLNRVTPLQHVNIVTLPFYFDAVHSVLGRFPLLLNTVALVNTPDIFGVILNFITPLLDLLTRDVLKVFGGNRETWSGSIRQNIDPNQLPERFGGYGGYGNERLNLDYNSVDSSSYRLPRNSSQKL